MTNHMEAVSMREVIEKKQQEKSDGPNKTLHIAPMLDVSNREFRFLCRILSKRAILWTEMVVDETLAYTDSVEHHLGYESVTQPLVCQIGGNSSEYSGKAVPVIENYGYQHINFNMDCPSNRVSGQREFGAVLMKKVKVAVEVLKTLQKSSQTSEVSVKMRIGVDEHDDFEFIVDLIEQLSPYCRTFFLHARKCLLGGILSPAQNRIVPPLNYPRVYQLCERFPAIDFYINGGISGLQAAKLLCHGSAASSSGGEHHEVPCHTCKAPNGSCTAPPINSPPNLRGCMLGRAAMDQPSMLWDVDRYFYGEPKNPCQNRRQVLERYCQFLERTYPRRCCDDQDNIMTTRIPAPTVKHVRAYCPVCRHVYGSCDHEENVDDAPALPSSIVKISSRVVDRSLKPVWGIFFGLPKSKTFRRACDRLSRDLTVRNCGPGYILRRAILEAVPPHILDMDFVETQNLTDIPVHVAPDPSGCCSRW